MTFSGVKMYYADQIVKLCQYDKHGQIYVYLLPLQLLAVLLDTA